MPGVKAKKDKTQKQKYNVNNKIIEERKIYLSLLKKYISQKGDARFNAAMEMGKALSKTKIPINKIKTLHEYSVEKLAKTASSMDELEASSLIVASFQELLSAYCMAFREKIEAQKHEQQLKEYSSELEKVNQSLKAANQELEDFAYVASHDLRAPLRAISNLSCWIEEDLESNVSDEIKTNLTLMKSRVSRMSMMIDDLLKYSRAGRLRVEPETVDSYKLINEIVDMILPKTGFKININDNMPILETAKAPFQQVFSNLIGNAIKHHGSEKGNIIIKVKETDKKYIFSVSDDGQGIPEEHHEKVFGMFKRLKSRDEVEGSGMGLALIKKIVTGAGGDVRLKSSKGKGCTFIIKWPKIWK